MLSFVITDFTWFKGSFEHLHFLPHTPWYEFMICQPLTYTAQKINRQLQQLQVLLYSSHYYLGIINACQKGNFLHMLILLKQNKTVLIRSWNAYNIGNCFFPFKWRYNSNCLWNCFTTVVITRFISSSLLIWRGFLTLLILI